MTSSHPSDLIVAIEHWPIAGSFTISRGAKTEAVTVVAEVSRGGMTGRGECVPYPRYSETPEARLAALGLCRNHSARAGPARRCRPRCPPGAARNALDCALIDLEAKAAGQRAWNLLGRPVAKGLHHGLYDLARHARGDGGGDREGRAPAAAEDQARRRRRRRADRGGAQGRAQIRADRRCQRGLDAGQSRAQSCRLRRCRRHAGRAAAAGRRRRGAGAHQAADHGLRRRERA